MSKEALRTVHWLETGLARHYAELDLSRGVDLDRNGAIEGTERTDRDGDGEVDSAEWQKFMCDNRSALETLGRHFKLFYSAGTAFKPDNPLHDLLSIESERASPKDVKRAYKKVEEILGIVKERTSKATLKPQEKLKLVYDAIKHVEIKYNGQYGQSFVDSINKKSLDCDTSSFVALAIANELGWPINLVNVPEHAFVRWDDGAGTRFNMDFGHIVSDSQYISKLNISQEAIDRGVYLTSLDHRGALSICYASRGSAKSDIGRYEEAIEDFDRAIKLDPNCIGAYTNRGSAKGNLGRYEEAIEDFGRAIELDPNYAKAYYNRGTTKFKLGRPEEAIEDFDKAIELNPNYSAAYHDRGSVKGLLGQYEEAIEDYDRTIELDPNDTDAYSNRGTTKLQLGRYEEAIEDYNKVIELDPKNAAAYYNCGNAKAMLERYEEALKDYDEAIKHGLNHAQIHNNRTYVRQQLAQAEEAIEEPDEVIEVAPEKENEGTSEEPDEVILFGAGVAPVQPPRSCLCNAPGQAGQASDPSLLSIILMLFTE